MSPDLTLFIIKSGLDFADADRTANSTRYSRDEVGVPGEPDYMPAVHFEPKVVHVLDRMVIPVVNTTHYMVLWDCEHLQESLAAAMSPIVHNVAAQIHVLHRRDATKAVTKSPRVFESGVELQPDSLMPKERFWEFETILDGFIFTNDIDQVQ